MKAATLTRSAGWLSLLLMLLLASPGLRVVETPEPAPQARAEAGR